jgi:hypothetical protein
MPLADLHSICVSRFGSSAHGLGSLMKLNVLSIKFAACLSVGGIERVQTIIVSLTDAALALAVTRNLRLDDLVKCDFQ